MGVKTEWTCIKVRHFSVNTFCFALNSCSVSLSTNFLSSPAKMANFTNAFQATLKKTQEPAEAKPEHVFTARPKSMFQPTLGIHLVLCRDCNDRTRAMDFQKVDTGHHLFCVVVCEKCVDFNQINRYRHNKFASFSFAIGLLNYS